MIIYVEYTVHGVIIANQPTHQMMGHPEHGGETQI